MSNLGRNGFVSGVCFSTFFGVAAILLLALTLLHSSPGQAQSFNVIHNFAGSDGSYPNSLTIDRFGTLYGTTESGGGTGKSGTVFKLNESNSNWVLTPLYIFNDGNDGGAPQAAILKDPNGVLYGTASQNGESSWGVVFALRPASTVRASLSPLWIESVLYNFTGGSDGGLPGSDLVMDSAGNLYGTTQDGGVYQSGTVFELSPSGSGWTQTVLHSFSGGDDGAFPYAGVVLDSSGNLYGTTVNGGGMLNTGTVYELKRSGSTWTEQVLYSFQGQDDGGDPFAGVILDPSGNLYGATPGRGAGGGGTVFELLPSNGTWEFKLIYGFTSNVGGGPVASLTLDGNGNLYGTAQYDGLYDLGSAFELMPTGNTWTYNSLHDFTGGDDGAQPTSRLVLDSDNNIYGTTHYGGANLVGVAFEITSTRSEREQRTDSTGSGSW